MKTGLLIIATGKYDRFVPSLLHSADLNFFPTEDVEYFVFTNHYNLQTTSSRKTTMLHIDHEAWPNPTLKRYDYFLAYRDFLSSMDYLFYSDVDMKFVAPIGSEILGDRVGTIHPGYHNRPRNTWTYETRKSSCAYIAPTEGVAYFAGGFVGGSAFEFLTMCNTISNWREVDARNGIIPVWHDESLLNKYYLLHPPTVSLDCSYCHPEKWPNKEKAKILALDKNHKEMRS